MTTLSRNMLWAYDRERIKSKQIQTAPDIAEAIDPALSIFASDPGGFGCIGLVEHSSWRDFGQRLFAKGAIKIMRMAVDRTLRGRSMKTLIGVLIFGTLLSRGFAQTSTTNLIKTPELLYVTSSSNLTWISNAVKIAAGLRVGVTKADVDNYLHAHGMQTNVGGLSLDRGRTMACFYGSLVLDMECSQPPVSGLFGWKNPLLKRACIQVAGANITSITFTNPP